MPTLTLQTGERAGAVFAFENPIVIGRSRKADVTLDDPSASRRHATFERHGRTWRVTDLDSANGTLINGRPVSRPMTVHPGDLITVGKAVFRYDEPEAAPPAASDTIYCVESQTHPRVVLSEPAEPAAAAVSSGTPQAGLLYRLAGILGTAFDERALLDFVLVELLASIPRAERGLDPAPRRRHRRPRAGDRAHPDRPPAGDELQPDDPRRRTAQAGRRGHHRRLAGGPPDRRRVDGHVRDPLGDRRPDRVSRRGVRRRADRQRGGRRAVRAQRSSTRRSVSRRRLAWRSPASACMRESSSASCSSGTWLWRAAFSRTSCRSALPTSTGIAFAIEYTPALAVGGDFYDFLQLAPNRLAIVLGDVSGKGVSAALFAARVTSDLRYQSIGESRATGVLDRVNRSLSHASRDGMFATTVVAVIDVATGGLSVASAGHLAPVLRTADGRTRLLELASGPPLGMRPQAAFPEVPHVLEPGEAMVLYSDGVTETPGEHEEQFGVERLLATVQAAGTSVRDISRAVRDEVARFSGSRPPHDDLTLVCRPRVGRPRSQTLRRRSDTLSGSVSEASSSRGIVASAQVRRARRSGSARSAMWRSLTRPICRTARSASLATSWKSAGPSAVQVLFQAPAFAKLGQAVEAEEPPGEILGIAAECGGEPGEVGDDLVGRVAAHDAVQPPDQVMRELVLAPDHHRSIEPDLSGQTRGVRRDAAVRASREDHDPVLVERLVGAEARHLLVPRVLVAGGSRFLFPGGAIPRHAIPVGQAFDEGRAHRRRDADGLVAAGESLDQRDEVRSRARGQDGQRSGSAPREAQAQLIRAARAPGSRRARRGPRSRHAAWPRDTPASR